MRRDAVERSRRSAVRLRGSVVRSEGERGIENGWGEEGTRREEEGDGICSEGR